MSSTLLVEAFGIVDEICDLPEAARQAVLDSRCAGRPELLAAVREIEAAPVDGAASPELRALVDQLLPAMAGAAAHDPLVGALIGFYRVGEPLGEGGMGRVYRAVHVAHQGPVAFKVLQSRPGWRRDRIERLRYEANLLARCRHPGIVQIYHLDDLPPLEGLPEGGTYFTMELVEGLPVTEFCSQRALSLRARLELFLRVCEAVQAAHDVGVIHRDLKPSNIIANEQGIKLLDFGVAEAFGDSNARPSSYMSGAYAAPEHLDETTTRTDVYSLGVLLAEMLVDRLPFDIHGETPAEQRLSVLQGPRPPLRRLAAGSGGPWLRPLRRLRWAELEAICDQAMQHNPAERYRAVKDLAADVQRFLEKKPVAAMKRDNRALHATYAGWRFLVRNAPYAAMSVVVVALLAALSISYAHALRQSRDAAQKARHTAEQQLLLVSGLFKNGDGSLNQVATTSAMLERGIHEAQIIDVDPEQKAGLFKTFGGLFQIIGNYDRADQLFAQALALSTKVHGADSPEAADILLQRSSLLETEGDAHAGLLLAQQARANLLHKLPASDRRVLEADTQIAECMTHLGQYAEAKLILENVVRRETGDPEATADLSTALTDLGNVENYLGNFHRTLELQQQAMEIDKVAEGPRHPDIGEHLITISNTYNDLGETAAATAAARQAVDILAASLAPDHHDLLAAQRQLAANLDRQGNYAEADALFNNVLTKLAREPRRSHTEATTLLQYGDLLRHEGKLADSLKAYEQGFTIYRQLYPKPNTFWSSSYFRLATDYLLMGRLPEAEKAVQETRRLDLELFGPAHVFTLQADILLARIRIAQHRYAEARTLLEHCKQLATAKDGATLQVLSNANEFLKVVSDADGKQVSRNGQGAAGR